MEARSMDDETEDRLIEKRHGIETEGRGTKICREDTLIDIGDKYLRSENRDSRGTLGTATVDRYRS
jgi:hypothetical protein